jgi:vacuolar protein sorting-associated protein 33B
MIFSNLTTFKHVLDQISLLKPAHSLESEAIKEFHIIVVPNLLFTFRNLVEMEGLDGIVSLYRFSWDFVKIDRNLLSLEIPAIYQQVFVQKDRTLLSGIANSFRIFNMIHKHPLVTFACGENSEKIVEMVSRMEGFKRRDRVGDEYPDFTAMLVIDRDIDYASCLLTPVTYSGLMIELFDMKAGTLNIDPDTNKVSSGKLEILKNVCDRSDSDVGDVKSLRMCGTSDELFNYNKYRHFSEVVNLIKAESKNLEQERRKYSRDMNIEQMKDFVEQNLPKVAAQKKVLYKHLIICERIVQEMSGNFERLQNVEEFIVRNENRKQVLNFIDENLNTNAHR